MVASIDDDFNRANGYLTSPWVKINGATNFPYITNNEAGTPASNGNYSAVHSAVLDSDDMEISVVIGTIAGGGSNNNMSNNHLWINAPNGSSAGSTGFVSDCVALQFRPIASTSQASMLIYSINTAGTATQRASVNGVTGGRFQSGDTVTFRCDGNVYTAYVNGVAQISWTDSTNIATRDANHRSVGFRAFRQTTSFPTTVYASCGFNSFHAQTLVVNTSGSDDGSGTDQASVGASLVGSDTSGAATETASIGGVIAPAAADNSGPAAETARLTIAGADASAPTADTATRIQLGAAADSSTTTESAWVRQTQSPPATDSGTSSETASISVTVFGTDAGQGLETVQGIVLSGRASDAILGTDDAFLGGQFKYVFEDAVADDTTGVRVALAASADAGQAADSAYSSFVTFGTDSSKPTVDTARPSQTSTPDSATGADAASVKAAASATDAGTGTETAPRIAPAAAGETGSAADSAKLAPAGAADTAKGTEGAAKLGVKPSADAGTGTELIQKIDAAAAVQDSGQWLEFVTVDREVLGGPRSFAVEAESREILVERENRTVTADSESRLVMVSRDLLVKPRENELSSTTREVLVRAESRLVLID